MNKRIAILPIALLSAVLMVRAEDLPRQPGVRRLEFVHYDPVAHVVEWAVSNGTVSQEGEYVPSESPNANFSINLLTGVMTRGQKDNPLGSTDAIGATRAFRALSMMLQAYTEHFENPASSLQEDSSGDDDLDDMPVQTLRAIAAPSLAPRHSGAAEGGTDDKTLVNQAAAAKEAFASPRPLDATVYSSLQPGAFGEGRSCSVTNPLFPMAATISWSHIPNQFFLPSKQAVAPHRNDEVARLQAAELGGNRSLLTGP
jgi:hypothetical protein